MKEPYSEQSHKITSQRAANGNTICQSKYTHIDINLCISVGRCIHTLKGYHKNTR